MKQVYKIKGMTCNNCVISVADELSKVKGVQQIDMNLEKAEAKISMSSQIPLNILLSALPNRYSISEKGTHSRETTMNTVEEKTKLQQLKPLLLIFLYLFAAVFLMHFKDWNTREAMLDFMGLFFVVFSFFKLLDLKGFPASFGMYDPLAKRLSAYGKVYPFIELLLGLMLLMRFQVLTALLLTILVLGITTIGVTKTLLNKKKIRCACLGTALKLPMTEATFIENSIMLLMAAAMLLDL